MLSLKNFVKKEMVFSISLLLAVASMIIKPPSKEYMDYIDFRVIVLLFSLMCVIWGFRNIHIFDIAADKLIKLVKNTRQLSILLVMMCFFSAMFITNDVALVTFVPFAIIVLTMADKKKYIINVVIMQTIAANMGSILLPVGNPQNLYLYSMSGLSFVGFMKLMLPYWILSLVLVIAGVMAQRKEPLSLPDSQQEYNVSRPRLIVFLTLFILCLLTVVKVIDYRVLILLVVAGALITDRDAIKKTDYFLLGTFICFFVFVGNIKQIGELNDWLMSVCGGNELTLGILLSQGISNVPCAILLSGFTGDISLLAIATDIGGLGTLVASLASLISYKIYASMEGSIKKKYFIRFTLINVLYLAILWSFAILIH